MADMKSLVDVVNALLQDGEPGNITKPDTNGYVGYEPQSIIDAMNDGFGIGNWGFEEISSETVDNEKGTLAVAHIAVWLAGVEWRPAAWGQSRVTRGDIGDAKKGAQTDAIKKALAYFSIGNRAYHGLLDGKKPQPVRPTQATSSTNAPNPFELSKMFKAIGTTIDKAQERTFKQVMPLDNLTPEQCAQLKAVYDHWKDARQKAS